jgi:hypothetical protein
MQTAEKQHQPSPASPLSRRPGADLVQLTSTGIAVPSRRFWPRGGALVVIARQFDRPKSSIAQRNSRTAIRRATYAAMISTPSAFEFQRMRRRTNKAEYDDVVIGQADLVADLGHAHAIVDAVRGPLTGIAVADSNSL